MQNKTDKGKSTMLNRKPFCSRCLNKPIESGTSFLPSSKVFPAFLQSILHLHFGAKPTQTEGKTYSLCEQELAEPNTVPRTIALYLVITCLGNEGNARWRFGVCSSGSAK